MQSVINYLKEIWTYIVSHNWSKDLLRGNLLFIVLIIFYNLFFHFHMATISGKLFFKFWILMNVCYALKFFLDAIFILINKEE